MKVKHIAGDEKGTEAHLGFHEAQAALLSGSVRVIVEVVTDFPTAGTGTDAVEAKEAGGEPDYDAMTRAELDALAAERKVDVSSAKNKNEVIAALKAK